MLLAHFKQLKIIVLQRKKTLFYFNRTKLSNVIVVLLLLRATSLPTIYQQQNFTFNTCISYVHCCKMYLKTFSKL